MGFGTLFIGYFLLLNVTYFGYTDLIAALIIMLGLYRLATVNKPFKYAFYAASALSVVGLSELVISLLEVFLPVNSSVAAISVVSPIRHTVIGVLSVLILIGIRDVAKEVGINTLSKKANSYIYVSAVLFLLSALFEIPISFIPTNIMNIIGFILILLVFLLIIVNLATIYTAYMRICMPEDIENDAPKKSKIGFVNKFREHEAEKQKEYAEYRIQKLNKKNKKKGKR